LLPVGGGSGTDVVGQRDGVAFDKVGRHDDELGFEDFLGAAPRGDLERQGFVADPLDPHRIGQNVAHPRRQTEFAAAVGVAETDLSPADNVVVGEREGIDEPVLDDAVEDVEVAGEIDNARRVAVRKANGDVRRPETSAHGALLSWASVARAMITFWISVEPS